MRPKNKVKVNVLNLVKIWDLLKDFMSLMEVGWKNGSSIHSTVLSSLHFEQVQVCIYGALLRTTHLWVQGSTLMPPFRAQNIQCHHLEMYGALRGIEIPQTLLLPTMTKISSLNTCFQIRIPSWVWITFI
jgi:hypothetical protein